MADTKWKTWKVPLIGLGILIVILAWLAFGERGLVRLHQTEMERQAHIERIRELVEENQALLEEIERLRTDMSYIESVARRELNLIRENEVVYRFDNQGTQIHHEKPWQPSNDESSNGKGKGLEE